MPHINMLLLAYEYPTGGHIWCGIYPDHKGVEVGVEHLIGVIENSAEDRNDPTQGIWYCERNYR